MLTEEIQRFLNRLKLDIVRHVDTVTWKFTRRRPANEHAWSAEFPS